MPVRPKVEYVAEYVALLMLCPVDIAFTTDRRSKRVLQLEPLVGAAGKIARSVALAHDALAAQRAGMLVDDAAVGVIGRIERDALAMDMQGPREEVLTFFDRFSSQVRSVELQQIEGA
jgi:hypothetical protein